MLAWRASDTSAVVFSQADTTRRYRSSLVRKPRLYWFSILTTSFSVAAMRSRFSSGTVMSAMATVSAPRVENL